MVLLLGGKDFFIETFQNYFVVKELGYKMVKGCNYITV